MKQHDSILFGIRSLVLVVAAVITGLPHASYCKDAAVALFIQQAPTQGGTITPSAGVHHFAPNSQVTLTAVPRSGYQFVYWLGDVGDPTARSTSIFLNEPKVVVAVFETFERDYTAGRSGGGGGRMFAAADDIGQHGWMGSHHAGVDAAPTTPTAPSFPAADVPEPTTILLLSLGAAFLRKRT